MVRFVNVLCNRTASLLTRWQEEKVILLLRTREILALGDSIPSLAEGLEQEMQKQDLVYGRLAGRKLLEVLEREDSGFSD